MTDKIKIKADKFVNDKKLKLNYIKPKDLKILIAEFCEEQIAELKAECDLAIEGRDIKIKELQQENAELKDYRLTTLAKQQTDMSKYALNLEHKLSWYDDQLTKAKEMIKELYESLDKLYLSGLSAKQIAFIEQMQDEAEQFLKEIK